MAKKRLLAFAGIIALALLASLATVLLAYHVFYSPFIDGLFSLYWTTLETGRESYVQGEAIQVFGKTRCAPSVQLFIDGTGVGNASVENGAYAALVQFEMEAGAHNLTMKAGACERSITLTITSPPCSSLGASAECMLKTGCPGKRYCLNGFWSACSPNKLACEPGMTRICTMPDGCHVGVQTCNACGSGWGECA